MTRDDLRRLLDRDVSRETYERLDVFARELLKWNRKINLVSRASEAHLWMRHIADSAQIWHLAGASSGRWVDLGSGGGLPGLVVAAFAADETPGLSVVLVESDQRKSAFLRSAARLMDLDVQVLSARIESLDPLNCHFLSARALAPLTDLLAHAHRHLDKGIALFPKGANFRAELSRALETWTFTCEEVTSRTDAEAVILKLGDIRPV